MSKKEAPKQTIETLLEKEKTKNRRIITAVLFAVGVLIGTIGGYFGSIHIITDSQSRAISVLKSKE